MNTKSFISLLFFYYFFPLEAFSSIDKKISPSSTSSSKSSPTNSSINSPGSPPTSSSLHSSTLDDLKKRLVTNPDFAISVIFDLPVTYNKRVTKWINYFQGSGHKWFKTWLERSTIHMPRLQRDLKKAGLPQDLAYMVMIESGFSNQAVSSANAVGPWQFIEATGKRYGLKVTPWLDERRDWQKSTRAAIRYLRDLYKEFGSWYLVAASYNMGENGLRRQVQKYQTRDFWKLAELKALPQETIDYVPKILAAMIITKAPSLYGFRNIPLHDVLETEFASVPGGLHLHDLAHALGVTTKSMEDLNAELLQKKIPAHVSEHIIRIPKGSFSLVAQYLEQKESEGL
jgi:membrane-bound lytic murein transglycosylase D